MLVISLREVHVGRFTFKFPEFKLAPIEVIPPKGGGDPGVKPQPDPWTAG